MTSPAKKYELSPHEKQMRFFTRLFVTIGAVGTALVFWLVNTSLSSRH